MTTWKRGFIEIVSEILSSLRKESLKKSHITYKCNLDARAVTKYIRLMLHLKLVERSKNNQEYKITIKGIRFIENYEMLTRFLQPDLLQTQELKGSSHRKKKVGS